MIVLGYPGVGKTAFCEESIRMAIDLDSSSFNRLDFSNDKAWAKTYVKIAESLSRQDFIVFISSHKLVQDEAEKISNMCDVITIIPSPDLKEKWIEILTDRYCRTGLEKDRRAMEHCEKYFDEDINYILHHASKVSVIEENELDGGPVVAIWNKIKPLLQTKYIWLNPEWYKDDISEVNS